jgi:hypothetical protein
MFIYSILMMTSFFRSLLLLVALLCVARCVGSGDSRRDDSCCSAISTNLEAKIAALKATVVR